MKKISMLFVSMVFACANSLAIAEPYAEKIEITSSTNPMSAMVIKAANVPNRASVSIPPYPGAKVFQTRDAGEMTMNDEEVKTLAYVKLLSTDPVEKIVAWYKEQLKEYSFKDFFGVSWAFWKGKGKFNSMDMRQTTTIQNVMISEANAAMEYDKDMKGAKSVIEVTYE